MRIPNKILLYWNMGLSFIRTIRFQLKGIDFEPPVSVGRAVALYRGFANGEYGKIHILTHAKISDGVVIDAWGGTVHIGEHVFVGPNTVIYGHGGVSVGKDTLIAMNCSIVSANHSIPTRDRRIRWEPDELRPVVIGEDVWIGAGVQILGGVKIGNGCVIGAGSVVTKSLPPYSVAVGNPATVIRMRDSQAA